MAADRQDHALLGDILVKIDKDGVARAQWQVNGVQVNMLLRGWVGADATQMLQDLLLSDAQTTRAAIIMEPERLLKFSFEGGRPGDLKNLLLDKLSSAPGCFMSMDMAMPLETGSADDLAQITFYLGGKLVAAVASAGNLQCTPLPSQARAGPCGRF